MTRSRRGIATGGTWCVDRNKLIDRWPAEDGTAEIHAIEVRGGGAACNMALDLKKLAPDLPVETIGLVGDDDDGRFLAAEADGYGIDREQLAVTGRALTHYTDAYGSRRSGRRTHIYYQGASGLLTPDHFDVARLSGRILHLGLPGVHGIMDSVWNDDPSGWVTVLKRARSVGLLTNLELVTIEPQRIAALARPCLPHLDFLIVNDVEIGAVAGEETSPNGETDIEACRRAAAKVLAQGSMTLVAVHFPKGGIALTRDGGVTLRPSVRVPPEDVVSANGAGDAFAAGMLYAVHEGWSIDDSLSLAHATAAASLRSMSTTDAVETWQACLALARRWGWREAI